MESIAGNAKRIGYVRLYEDSAGESHFEDVEAPLQLVDLGPSNPSPPLYGDGTEHNYPRSSSLRDPGFEEPLHGHERTE